MARQIVFTSRAAKPPATYSQAVKAAGLVFVSGTAPHDPETGTGRFLHAKAVCFSSGGRRRRRQCGDAFLLERETPASRAGGRGGPQRETGGLQSSRSTPTSEELCR